MPSKKSGTTKKSALTKATEKRVREIAKSVEKTGRLWSPSSKKWVKPTTRSIASKAKILGQRDLEKAGKQVVKDTRQINKTAKEAIKLINALFGEKEKPTRKQKQAPTRKQPTPKAQPKKTPPSKTMRGSRIYDLEDLPEAFNNATLTGTLEELQENSDYYNSLLRPGDVFGARVGFKDSRGVFHGGYTHSTYGNFDLFVNAMRQYRFVRDYGDDDEAADDLKSMIKIVRFKAPGKNPTQRESAKAWKGKKREETTKREAQTEKRKAEKKALKRQISEQKKELQRKEKQQEKTELELRIANKKLAMRKQNRGGKK